MVLPRLRADSCPYQGAVADALALHPGHSREHGEHDAGGVVRSLQFPGEELQADVARLHLLGEQGEFDTTAQPLALRTTRVTATPEEQISPASLTGFALRAEPVELTAFGCPTPTSRSQLAITP